MLKKKVDRKVLRFPARLALLELNGEPAFDSHLVDISSLGAQLETPLFFPLNTAVEVVVRFPWGDREVRLSGLTRWIKPLIGRPGRFRIGVRFYQPFWEIDQLAREGKL